MARKKKKNKEFPWSIIIVSVVTFFISIALMVFFGKDFMPGFTPDGKRSVKHSGIKKDENIKVSLYFSHEDGKNLAKEKTTIKHRNIEQDIEDVLGILLQGPKEVDHFNVIPDGTKLISVKVKNNIANINLSKEIITNHPGGSTWELQTVYSIVNTITITFENIKSVQILVNGKKEETLNNHVIIYMPLKKNTSIIKS